MMDTQLSAQSVAGRKQSKPYNQASPFSPAQRMHVQEGAAAGTLGTVGTSATLINVGNTVMSNQFDMSSAKLAIQ